MMRTQSISEAAKIAAATIVMAICLSAALMMPPPQRTAAEDDAGRVRVGAIRWDGWAGYIGSMGFIADQSRKMLAPDKFRFRTPFFAKVTGKDSIEIKTTQESMDREIGYARSGGIDYWAFQWYAQGSGFDVPLNTYLDSSRRNDVKFCYLLYSTNFVYVRNEIQLLASRMTLANYLTVDGGRPLVYLMHNTWTQDDIATLREAADAAGLPPLYLVFMDWSGSAALAQCDTLGGQATSAYCSAGGNGQAYSDFAGAESIKWDTYISFNYDFIPFVTTGWDPRPIGEYIESAPKAEQYIVKTWYPTECGPDYYIQTATPDEIAGHLREGVHFVRTHESSRIPNAVIMYAWNEFTEGGWICPVISGGSQRLDAIRSMLDEYASVYSEESAISAVPTQPASQSQTSVASSDPANESSADGLSSLPDSQAMPASSMESAGSDPAVASSAAASSPQASKTDDNGPIGQNPYTLAILLILLAGIIASGILSYFYARRRRKKQDINEESS